MVYCMFLTVFVCFFKEAVAKTNLCCPLNATPQSELFYNLNNFSAFTIKLLPDLLFVCW